MTVRRAIKTAAAVTEATVEAAMEATAEAVTEAIVEAGMSNTSVCKWRLVSDSVTMEYSTTSATEAERVPTSNSTAKPVQVKGTLVRSSWLSEVSFSWTYIDNYSMRGLSK